MPGLQAGFEFSYYTRRFTVSIQPMFSIQNYGYSTSYRWEDENDATNVLEQNYEFKNELQHLDFPLIVRYDLMTGVWRPYVQAGGYVGVLLNASKEVSVRGTDSASGSPIPFEGEPLSVGATNLYNKTSAGVVGGIGVAYRAGNVRFTFDINYRYGLTNIVDEGARYSDDRLTSIGDVMDDQRLESLWFTIGTQFPLKFISKNYDAVN